MIHFLCREGGRCAIRLRCRVGFSGRPVVGPGQLDSHFLLAWRRRFGFPPVEVKISAKGGQMADGVGKIHDARGFPGGAVKRDDGDILPAFEGGPNESAKHRFGADLDEGTHTVVVKAFNRILKAYR